MNNDQETIEITMQPEGIETPIDNPNNPNSITCHTNGCGQVFSDLVTFEGHLKNHHTQRNDKGQFIQGNTASVGLTNSGAKCRMCEHKDEYLTKIKNYLDKATGEKPQMIYLGEICIMLDITKNTFGEWRTKKKEDGTLEHPEYSHLIERAEAIQETRLQQRVLGRYNPTGAIFLLKTKHGYMETDKRVLAGDSKDPLEIIITEEDK